MGIIPIILAGGSGTRLWPLSQPERPKQFLKFGGDDRTLFQRSLERCSGPVFATSPIIVASQAHSALVAEQLHEVGLEDASILLEPVARNTCAAVAAGCLHAVEQDEQAIVLVAVADHWVSDAAAFGNAAAKATEAAGEGWLVCFGIRPTAPHAAYGYVEPDSAVSAGSKTTKVHRFTEKPTLEKARQLITNGALWNSGNFLMRACNFLGELKRLQPQIFSATKAAHAERTSENGFQRLAMEHLRKASALSVDHAVMELSDKVAVLPVSYGWSDLGTWNSITEHLRQIDHGEVHRPWGHFQCLQSTSSQQTKYLSVKAGQQLSLQLHRHRAETWHVIEGTARITLNGKTWDITTGESVHIPQGAVHRLANTTADPLIIIEVQTGTYFGEDDIVRLEDAYQRQS